MNVFGMCPSCEKEYEDPFDRRFHAQPNACRDCGPRLFLCDAKGKILTTNDPISLAASFLSQGKILALKGLGGFHLAADAVNESAVNRLRKRKIREQKPFALMSNSTKVIERYAILTLEDKDLITSIQRPIVIVPKRDPFNLIAGQVAPDHEPSASCCRTLQFTIFCSNIPFRPW